MFYAAGPGRSPGGGAGGSPRKILKFLHFTVPIVCFT